MGLGNKITKNTFSWFMDGPFDWQFKRVENHVLAIFTLTCAQELAPTFSKLIHSKDNLQGLFTI